MEQETISLGTYTEEEIYQNLDSILEKCHSYPGIIKLLSTSLFSKFKKQLHFDKINSLVLTIDQNYILRIVYNLESKTSIFLDINKYFGYLDVSIKPVHNPVNKKCYIM